ncbi:mannose-6-phosphate isomerase [Trichoderma harzianum]|uniref:Mannose-6-phosphate isomerase n=1 Tax=Trichoderma harzianum TaxID=5544 RepID=A0A0F9X9L3_TRIHA|nr:mannose-6-phosphate isomerase [Trichoderma harzianum]
MPRPTKRAKRSNTAEGASSSSIRRTHSSPSYEHESPANKMIPIDEVDVAMDPRDPIMLDEEEMPEAEQAPANKDGASRAYAFGGGGYNSLKSFNGRYYSGMAVGGSHTWNYDGGVWHEVKEEPDLWKIDYKTNKRRAKKAPDKSGAPVGTEYHWLIVAHQHVRKIDANTYETNLEGSKYKLAHKGAASNTWSIPTVKGQREREVELLEDAKRRVQGLPPVLGSEKVKVKSVEKGQQKLEDILSKGGILSIGKALPLQIHPNKSLAAKLHEKDPEKFSDTNHKPEIAVALSQFELFAGWRDLGQISAIFNIPSLRRFIPEGSHSWNEETLRSVVRGILKADEQTVQNIEEDLKRQSQEDIEKLGYPSSMFELTRRLQSQYSATDPGVLIAILCMNYLVLEPGEAIFIPADGVHCYLSGDIVECMARSNNMLSGGLCPVADRDNIDLFSETLKIDSSTRVDNLRLPANPSKDGASGHTLVYQPPIGEFDMIRIEMTAGTEELIWNHKGPTVAIAISGEGTIRGDGKELAIKTGFIFFIAAETETMLRADTGMRIYAAVIR